MPRTLNAPRGGQPPQWNNGSWTKRHLTEQEIRTRYITPAICGAGWPHSQVRDVLAAAEVRARLLQP